MHALKLAPTKILKQVCPLGRFITSGLYQNPYCQINSTLQENVISEVSIQNSNHNKKPFYFFYKKQASYVYFNNGTKIDI